MLHIQHPKGNGGAWIVESVGTIAHWPVVPPWLLPTPEVKLSTLMSDQKKGSTSYRELFASRLNELLATPSSNIHR